MFSLILALVAALPVEPVELRVYAEAEQLSGIAELDGTTYAIIAESNSLARLGRRGQTIAAERARGIGGRSLLVDLCAAGELLAVTDARVPAILLYDPDDLTPRGAVSLAGANPAGIAHDGEAFWVADQATLRLLRVDPTTGAVLASLPTPGIAPRGLDYRAGRLWLLDSIDQAVYRIEPETGRVEAGIQVPGGQPRGVLARDGAVDVSYVDTGSVLRVPYLETDDYTLSLPVEAKVEARITLTPRGDAGAPEGATLLLGEPTSTIRQEVHGLTPFPAGFTRSVDGFGSPVIAWSVPALAPGEEFRCGWRAKVQTAAIRYKPGCALPDPPPDRVYLRPDEFIRPSAPVIQALVEGIPNGSPEELLRELTARVCDRLTYERDGSWEPADVVLERGTGSCSEYSYVFASALRGLGTPVRFAGSTVLVGPPRLSDLAAERIDRPLHRWPEVYLSGRGWLPVDPTNMDRSTGRPYGGRRFLALGHNLLVCSRGPAHEGTALGQDYVERLLTPPGANAWLKDREIAWVVTRPLAWEVAAARRVAGAEWRP